MKSKALVCNQRQEFSLEDVQLPEPEKHHLGIRTVYSGISVGTEFALVRNRISWGALSPRPRLSGGWSGRFCREGCDRLSSRTMGYFSDQPADETV